MDNIIFFLQEITRLTRTTGIEIAGCGCCGSPWIVGYEFRPKDIKWNDKTRQYDCEDIEWTYTTE